MCEASKRYVVEGTAEIVILHVSGLSQRQTVVIPQKYDLHSVLLSEFIRDFRITTVFRRNQVQVAREIQLMMKAVSLYL